MVGLEFGSGVYRSLWLNAGFDCQVWSAVCYEGSELLEVSTGCRLHFGLLELAEGERLRFGGLGLMLDEPGWKLRFGDCASESRVFDSLQPEVADRIAQVRERLRLEFDESFEATVSVKRTLPLHSGLGAGTQLAAAAALGLFLAQFSEAGKSPLDVRELVRWTGRGKRSGIGLFGFVHGGLILDEGHSASESSEIGRSVSATSTAISAEWRVVLITPDQTPVVTGNYEANLLGRLGQEPNPARANMFELAKRIQACGSRADGFVEFTELLQEYVDSAGKMFAASQGGLYNGESVAHAVDLAKRAGLRAVGQSSWGPTVFGFASDSKAAERIAARLRDLRPNSQWRVQVSSAARRGCEWQRVAE